MATINPLIVHSVLATEFFDEVSQLNDVKRKVYVKVGFVVLYETITNLFKTVILGVVAILGGCCFSIVREKWTHYQEAMRVTFSGVGLMARGVISPEIGKTAIITLLRKGGEETLKEILVNFLARKNKGRPSRIVDEILISAKEDRDILSQLMAVKFEEEEKKSPQLPPPPSSQKSKERKSYQSSMQRCLRRLERTYPGIVRGVRELRRLAANFHATIKQKNHENPNDLWHAFKKACRLVDRAVSQQLEEAEGEEFGDLAKTSHWIEELKKGVSRCFQTEWPEAEIQWQRNGFIYPVKRLKNGWCMRGVKGDGNCFYYAFTAMKLCHRRDRAIFKEALNRLGESQYKKVALDHLKSLHGTLDLASLQIPDSILLCYVKALREMAYNYLQEDSRKFPEQYSMDLLCDEIEEESMDEFLGNILKSGHYANAFIINAFSSLFQRGGEAPLAEALPKGECSIAYDLKEAHYFLKWRAPKRKDA